MQYDYFLSIGQNPELIELAAYVWQGVDLTSINSSLLMVIGDSFGQITKSVMPSENSSVVEIVFLHGDISCLSLPFRAANSI